MLAPPETIAAITKKNVCPAAEQVAYVKKRHPEVTDIFGDFKFRGKDTPDTRVGGFEGPRRIRIKIESRHSSGACKPGRPGQFKPNGSRLWA